MSKADLETFVKRLLGHCQHEAHVHVCCQYFCVMLLALLSCLMRVCGLMRIADDCHAVTFSHSGRLLFVSTSERLDESKPIKAPPVNNILIWDVP